MDDSIKVAKSELYRELKSKTADINGAGIREKNHLPYIVIFISKSSAALLRLIPKRFHGLDVVTEVRPMAKIL